MKRIRRDSWSLSLTVLTALLVLAYTPLAGAQTLANGIYTLTSVSSNLKADDQGSTTNGTSLEQTIGSTGNTNQQWQLTNLGGGRYTLLCLSSGLVMDAGTSTSAGSAIVTNQTSGGNSQQWQLVPVSGLTFQLVNVNSGLALDNGGSTTSGSTLTQQVQNAGNAGQQWTFALVQIGATTPFTSYEAESATLGGGATVMRPSAEASRPRSIFMSMGHFVRR